MNGWTKVPIDGNRIVGADHLVYSGKVSWRNTTTLLRQATLSHNGLMIKINGYGEYWQADDFELGLNQKRPHLLRRRISKQIAPNDVGISVEQQDASLTISIPTAPSLHITKFFGPEQCGCWINVEIIPDQQKLHYYITKDRI